MKDRRDWSWAEPTAESPPTMEEVIRAWIEFGTDAYDQPDHRRILPPLGEREIQRAWLSGFVAAWCDDLPETPHHQDEATLTTVLTRALMNSPMLLSELLSISTHAEKHRMH